LSRPIIARYLRQFPSTDGITVRRGYQRDFYNKIGHLPTSAIIK
jgi:hypothetical protein